MRKITVFDNLSLDGYFTDAQSDMSWAHKHDEEWTAFSSSNASGEAELLFGSRHLRDDGRVLADAAGGREAALTSRPA